MLKSNNNGDATIKCLNLDLFNEGYSVFVLRFYPNSNVIFQFICKILENFVHLSTPRE